APKSELVVSPRRGQSRGPRQATNSWSTQPAWSHRGRRSMANDHKGSSGNLGDPVVSIEMPAGDPAYQLQVIHGLVSWAVGDKRGTQRWYRQAKETKRGEMGGRE